MKSGVIIEVLFASLFASLVIWGAFGKFLFFGFLIGAGLCVLDILLIQYIIKRLTHPLLKKNIVSYFLFISSTIIKFGLIGFVIYLVLKNKLGSPLGLALGFATPLIILSIKISKIKKNAYTT